MSCCGVCIEALGLQIFCQKEEGHEGLHYSFIREIRDGTMLQWNDEACKHYDWEKRELIR